MSGFLVPGGALIVVGAFMAVFGLTAKSESTAKNVGGTGVAAIIVGVLLVLIAFAD